MSGPRFGWGMAVLCAAMTARSAGARAVEASDEPPPMDATVERELATTPRLATILRVIGERNPDLREADERARASELRTPAAARRPDPEVKGEAWGVPLARPAAFDQANTLMLGLRQSFPAWGSLAARER